MSRFLQINKFNATLTEKMSSNPQSSDMQDFEPPTNLCTIKENDTCPVGFRSSVLCMTTGPLMELTNYCASNTPS
jgi:hypothetical protein